MHLKKSIALAIFGFMSSAHGMMRSPCGYPPYSGEESDEFRLPYSPSTELKKNSYAPVHSNDINQISRKAPVSGTDDLENAEDQFRVGNEYYNGQGVKQDFPKSFEYFKKAAHQGHKEAQYNLGFMYYNGQGVNQNFPKSFEYFKKAAVQEHKEAQFRIGFMYYNGQGVIEQDSSKALKYFRKAADQGHRQAQSILGDNKPIVFKKTKESLPLGRIEKSEKKNEHQASGALGLALAQGNKKAIEYFEKANNERDGIIEKEKREIIDFMVSGEGEAQEEIRKNQTTDKKITKTLLRSRSMVSLSKPIDNSIGEENLTQEIKQTKPRKKLQRAFSVKEFPTAEGSVQMADMLAEEKPSDKKNKRPLTLSPFRNVEPTNNKKSNREVDKKDKKNNDKKNKKRIKLRDIKKLRNKNEEKNLICASEESSLSESENENETKHDVILQSPLIMKPKEKSILDKIFDIVNKPEITENEFINFCASDAMKGIIPRSTPRSIAHSKTKSGFLLKFKHEEKSASASAHWEHGSNKLDPGFIREIRKILDSMGITPEKVTIKA